MSWWMEVPPDGPEPKRGDILQTAVGTRRQRTWLILAAKRRPKYGFNRARFTVWRVRWWELEPDMRMRLYRSASRNGGQEVWHFTPYKKPKKHRPL